MNDSPPTLSRPPLLAAFFVTLVVLVVGAELTGYRLWGFSFLGYYALVSRVLIIGLAAGLGCAGYFLLPKLISKTETTDFRRFVLVWVSLSLVTAALWYVFRAQTYFFGDGYALIDILCAPETIIKARNWAGTIVAYLLMLASGERTVASATTAYMWASVLAGLAFLAIAGHFAVRIYADLFRRLALFVGLLLGGYALQFFGYVENYPWFLVVVLAFALFGWWLFERKTSALWLLVLAIVAMGFHTFGVALVIPALFAVMAKSKASKKLAKTWKQYKIAIITTSVVLAIVALFVAVNRSMYIRYAIVEPLDSALASEGYTMFSLAHLLDMLSLLFVLAPGVGVVGVAIWRLRKVTVTSPTAVFLFLLTLCSWGVVFLLEAELGVPRDWDLFAFAGIPTVALFAHLMLTGSQHLVYLATAWWLAVVLSLTVLVTRVGVIASPERAVALFTDYEKLDVAKSPGVAIALQEYFDRINDTTRLAQAQKYWSETYPYFEWMSLGARYLEAQKFEEARIQFQRTLDANPLMNRAWLGMGMYFAYTNRLDSAQRYLDMAYGLDPLNSTTAAELGHLAYLRRDYDLAERFLEEAAALSWEYDTPLYNLAQLKRMQGDQAGYFEAMERAVKRAYVEATTVRALADAYRQAGNNAKAQQYYRMADSISKAGAPTGSNSPTP